MIINICPHKCECNKVSDSKCCLRIQEKKEKKCRRCQRFHGSRPDRQHLDLNLNQNFPSCWIRGNRCRAFQFQHRSRSINSGAIFWSLDGFSFETGLKNIYRPSMYCLIVQSGSLDHCSDKNEFLYCWVFLPSGVLKRSSIACLIYFYYISCLIVFVLFWLYIALFIKFLLNKFFGDRWYQIFHNFKQKCQT